jgi:hypothetical protein
MNGENDTQHGLVCGNFLWRRTSQPYKDLDSQLMPLTKKELYIFVYKVAEHLKILHLFNI